MVTESATAGQATPGDRVTAVHKIARLMDEIAAGSEPRSLTDLARALGFPKSTVADLCASLAEERMLQRVPGRRYKLGVGLVEIVDELLHETRLVQLFAAQVRGSTALSGRTVFMSTVQDDDDVVIEVVNGSDPLPVTPYPGMRSNSDGTSTAARNDDGVAVHYRGDVISVSCPISRATTTAPPVHITAMLPAATPAPALRAISTALQRLSTTLSIHGGAAAPSSAG